MSEQPAFPPLMSGDAVSGQADPFEVACQRAVLGCDAGLIVYNLAADRLRAALVFAPEVPLEHAMAMLPACGIGFQNALGALAPPEVAMHLEWDGKIRINGASCGLLRAAASSEDPTAVPDWLVIGFDLPLWPEQEDGGQNPGETALYAEGCAGVSAPDLLESWARHTLHWIARWEEAGNAPLHREWRGLLHGVGEAVTRQGIEGSFLGLDENFNMLLRDGETTHLVPLSSVLERF